MPVYVLPLPVQMRLHLNFVIGGMVAGSSYTSSVPSQVIALECTRTSTCIMFAVLMCRCCTVHMQGLSEIPSAALPLGAKVVFVSFMLVANLQSSVC